MKKSNLLIFTAILILNCIAYSQSIITFDNKGWSSDQSIDTIFTIDNFTFSSNKSFYTNYGYNFDVNNVSIYYAFQNSVSDHITITTVNNELVNLSSLAAYQVSEASTDTLVIEGWEGSNKKYSTNFSNNNAWHILTLNFNGINKLIIKSGNLGSSSLSDYNFDNFTFNNYIPVTDTIQPKLIGAAVINPTSIELIFSESMENGSALNKSNYSINNGIIINSVSITSDNKKVTLNTTQNTANQTYTVIVSNVKDSAGNIISPNNNSAQYSYIGDSTPPELLSATILDSVTVELLFSEEIKSNTAQNKSNYLINNGITVENAYLSANQNKVTLQTTNHVSGQSYNIVAQNIIDLADNSISNKNSAQYFYFIDNIAPDISAISITNYKSVTVKFSERLDPNAALNKNNYNISNNVSINQIQILPDSSGVLLRTTQQQSGTEYTLTVSNIKDRSGNLISPNPKLKDYKLPVRNTGKPIKNTIQSATSGDWLQNLSPDKSIDGIGMSDPLSRWCSDRVLPDTIEFDLGNTYPIDSLRISFYEWESDRLYKYSVYSSNDLISWIPVIEEVWSDNLEWTEIMFNSIEKRFIKVVLLESNQSAQASIWEIEMYGVDKLNGLSSSNIVPLNSYELSQNYPNPFNPSTIISYTIPNVTLSGDEGARVQLKVYDILGNEVATLVDEQKEAGNYSVTFSAGGGSAYGGNAGNLSSGVYIYKLSVTGGTNNFVSTKKMLMIK